MKIAIAQLNPTVGAFEENQKKIEKAYERALQVGARLLLTPELGVCGYPLHDLLDRPEMTERNEKVVSNLAKLTQGKNCALLVGHVGQNPSSSGKRFQNTVSVLENGKAVFRQSKTLLPTYDVFDEARHFAPAQERALWNCDGTSIAIAICEDLWAKDPSFGRTLYGRNPVEDYQKLGADLVLSLSASPYEWGKRERREFLHSQIAKDLKVPLVYVNQVGATDEVLFDGASFAVDASGTLQGRLSFFEDGFGVYDTEMHTLESDQLENETPSEIEILARALVTGIREYFQITGFKKAVLGLSGGIDSAVVATLLSRAIGSKNVLGVAMPSLYSSGHSLSDAEALAKNLGCRFETRPIKFIFSTFSRELSEKRGQLNDLALENLQARLRGTILMTYANHDGALAVSTGNKSELATGYCTLYGDMVGALSPIGDLFKTRVYELARYLNQAWGNPIPENSISKAPSAELRPDQKDQDTLPPYEALDALLEDYIENQIPLSDLEKKYSQAKDTTSGWVSEILKKVELNEYKRRQSAIVLKTSSKAFGIGRRVPIAKRWDA